MRRGGGIGFVLLIVVLAVVLLLVARSWKSVGPTALDVTNGTGGAAVDDHGEAGAGEAVRSGDLPDLGEMKSRTDAHAEQVQEALAEIE